MKKVLPKIDFHQLKTEAAILPELLRHIPASEIKRSSKREKYYVCCWIHSEETPSMCINTDTNTYHCFGCGASGSVLDVRIAFMGLNPKSGIDVVKAAQSLLQDIGSGRTSAVAGTEDFEKLKTSKKSFEGVKRRYFQAQPEFIQRSHKRLLGSAPAVRDYAERRGWLIPESRYPIGAGYSFGPAENELVLEFPKIIQTGQTASCFGFEKQWEEWNGKYVIDLKKRLTPRAEILWQEGIRAGKVSEHIKKPPRWTAIPDYHDWVPWEFDSRNARVADVLCITEGPGDGLRLENELIRNGVEYNFHVTAIDSASSLKSQNFVRVISEKKMQSFFDGFKEIWFFFDNDQAGNEAVLAARDLLGDLKPKGTAKFVSLPRIVGSIKDLSDYFDNEGCVLDLFDEIEKTDKLTFN